MSSLIVLYASHSPVTSCLAVILVAGVVALGLYRWFLTPQARLNVPTLGRNSDDDFRAALVEGWSKFRDTIYRVPFHHHDVFILPQKYVDDIKSQKEDKISFQREIDERHQGYHTLFRNEDDVLLEVVKQDLTRSLVHVLDALQDEAKFVVKQELGGSHEWHSLPIYNTMLRMISLLSGRIFIGLPTSRNEEWMKTSINYTTDVVRGSAELVRYPPWSRWFMARFIKAVKNCRGHAAVAYKLLSPIITARLQEEQKLGFQKPKDVIQWQLDGSLPKLRKDMNYQTIGQLKISFAAIHTTSQNLTHVFLDLAARPEYIKPLREELEAVLAENDGILTKQSITKLRKMDSFMKEVQRVNPPSILGMQRKIMSDFKLHDGIVLPKGSYTGTNLWSSNLSEEVWGKNAHEFDGMRYEKLRSQPGNEQKYQFVTSDLNSLVFGLGKHACPGRFFASNEMKVLLARTILEYDMKLEDGQSYRPENLFINFANLPSPAAHVMFRRRHERHWQHY